jgi:hypothetical protein
MQHTDGELGYYVKAAGYYFECENCGYETTRQLHKFSASGEAKREGFVVRNKTVLCGKCAAKEKTNGT